jgi:23S rRNA (cytidine1920-2'-O)/16S rRNA (cytidine1409-2'-O)-methyltransferase
VTNLEKINARHLTAADLPRTDFDVAVMDLSFISLKSVLPSVWPLLRAGGVLVALVKPQFEAGKAEADRGQGVIRDPAVHTRVVGDITAFAAALPGATVLGTIPSPLTGADGNREFLLAARKA